MRTGIYAVFDLVAQALMGNAPHGLMLHKHPAAAIRVFIDALSDPATVLNKHPQDFDLVLLGYFDEDKGAITLPDAMLLDQRTFDGEAAPWIQLPPAGPFLPREIVLSGKQWKLSQESPPETFEERQGNAGKERWQEYRTNGPARR